MKKSKLSRDIKNSYFLIKPIFVISMYRFGNSIYESNLFLKKIILILFKIANLFLIEVPFNTELPFQTSIGYGLRLTHPYGIIVHKSAIIGNNCTIFQYVTIGATGKSGNVAPKIGNNVYIGAGAKILGDIRIGNNVKIGANAVVTKNIPSNRTVVKFNEILN